MSDQTEAVAPPPLAPGSLREKILTANDLKSEMFTSKAWGVTVRVRGMTRERRAELTKDYSDEAGKLDTVKFAPALLIETMIDPLNDSPIFTEADRDALNKKSWQGIEEAIAVALRVCGFTDEVVEKNSERTASSEAASV